MHINSTESDNVDVTKCCRVGGVGGVAYVIELAPFEATKFEVVTCKDIIIEETHVDPTTCSRVSGSESMSLLEYLLILKEVMELYFKGEEKLRNELK
jgi:hypothetical protein